MPRISPGTVFLASLVTAWLAASILRGQQQAGPEPSPNEGVLVLRNGSLLRGEITQVGDRYDVAVDGGRIQVRASNVEFRCQTLDEAYQRKRASGQPGDVRVHLELAQWCQRHGLLNSAVRELGEAKALAPNHPLIPLVERRIQMSLCRPEKPEKIDEPAKPADLPPSPDDLDRLVRGMPPGSVEMFTQTVQPLLANACSAAGCHGPHTESEFQLLRIPSGRPPGRRLTQRNLHSTLEWIDREDPAASKLLTAPIQAHGSAKAAIFTDQQMDRYQQIVNWVYLVTQKPYPVSAVSYEAKRQLPRQDKPPWSAFPVGDTVSGYSANRGFPGGSGNGPVPAPEAPPPSGQFDLGPAGLGSGETSTIPSPTNDGNSGLRPSAPIDPFDPDVFNRRFHR